MRVGVAFICLMIAAAAVGLVSATSGHTQLLESASTKLGLNAADVSALHAGLAMIESDAAAEAVTTGSDEEAADSSALLAAAAGGGKPKSKKRVTFGTGKAPVSSADSSFPLSPTPSAVRRMDLGKIRNAVVQIVCAHSAFNWKAPWSAGAEAEVLGTGFFVMIDGHSYIITNAHVVKEAIKVRIRVPDIGLDNFAADVFGICYEKDIALLRLRADDTAKLATIRARAGGQIEHLTLGDSDRFSQGSVAVAVGYPLGQANLKFSTGILSGYEHVSERLYLQITAPINPGNSGGPLLSTNGLVMGVNTAAYEKASNVGYAIPSSHIRALLNDFVKQNSRFITPASAAIRRELRMTPAVIQQFPYLGAGLAPATVELCRFLKYTGEGGVFVRKVAPVGVCHDAGLRPRDLLLAFDGHKLDRFGKTFRSKDSTKSGSFRERLSIFDLAERIEIGKTIALSVWRDGAAVELSTVFQHRAEHDYAVPKIVEPVRQSVQYIVVGGVVFMDLALNHIELLVETNPSLINYFRGRHRTAPRVVVSGVLPECTLPEDSVNPGELVTRVNGVDVTDLGELQTALDTALTKSKAAEKDKASADHWFTVETSENSLVVFDLKKVDTRRGTASHQLGQKFTRSPADRKAIRRKPKRKQRKGKKAKRGNKKH